MKSATLARDAVNPNGGRCPTFTRYRPLAGPSVRRGGRTIVHSRALARTTRSIASESRIAPRKKSHPTTAGRTAARNRKAAETSSRRLTPACAIARQIHDTEKDILELCSGAGVVAPALSNMLKAREARRYEALAPLVALLGAAGRLRPGLEPESAHDILWTFTGREIYRMLIRERGWSSERYEKWLAETLVRSLIG
jgi:hypothetical protein